MLIQDNVNYREYSTLLSLISSNKGDYDICALIWDICTNNFELYLEETLLERVKRMQDVSLRAFEDLKYIINIIKNKYIGKKHEIEDKELMIHLNDAGDVEYVSSRFDAIMIYNIIERFYKKELYI